MSWDLIGHEWAVDMLRQHLQRGRVRHAYLFVGPDGVGKRTLALRFAQALNCEDQPAADAFCGRCRPCRTISAQAYPDLHVVASPEAGGTLDVEQVRDLQRQLSLAPYEGRKRVALLLRFHEASLSAANALLKTLEEPPPQVVLLLTARAVESLLPTIVSRCEVIRLRAVPVLRLEAELKARGVEAEDAGLIAGLAGGRAGWGIQWAAEPEILERLAEVADDLMRLLQESNLERFAYVDSLTRGNDPLDVKRQRVVEHLEMWMSLWRDLILRTHGTDLPPVNRRQIVAVDEAATTLPPGEVLRGLQALQAALDAVSKNANLRLALEALMLDLPRLRGG